MAAGCGSMWTGPSSCRPTTGAHAQELHLAIGHSICDLVEQRLGEDHDG
jgi:hypothetical protein